MTTAIERAQFRKYLNEYVENADNSLLEKAKAEADVAYKRAQMALREHEVSQESATIQNAEHSSRTRVIQSGLFGVPKFILQNPLADFAIQLCNEIPENRKRLVDSASSSEAEKNKYAISANPSCVVSRNMMNYMLMAFAPGFSTKNVETYEDYNAIHRITRRPAYARVTEQEMDYREAAKQNHDLYLIAQNLISYEVFLKENDKVNFMRLVVHNGQINFGVDSSLEDWQARVEYGTGDCPETLEGITDNRLYK